MIIHTKIEPNTTILKHILASRAQNKKIILIPTWLYKCVPITSMFPSHCLPSRLRLNVTFSVVAVQSISHVQLFVSWESMDCSMPGFPVLHHLLEFAQTRVHWVQWLLSNHLILCCSLLFLPLFSVKHYLTFTFLLKIVHVFSRSYIKFYMLLG